MPQVFLPVVACSKEPATRHVFRRIDFPPVSADARLLVGSISVPALSSGGRTSQVRTRPRALRNRPPKKSIRQLSSSWDDPPPPPPPPLSGGETRGQQARTSAGEGTDQDGLVRIESYHSLCFAPTVH